MTTEYNETMKNSRQGETKIDEDLYSRQLFVLGHEAMKEMMKKRILIIGLDGLGQEIAKNVCLAGVKKVELHDIEIVSCDDLGSGFYFTRESIGKRKDQAVVDKISGVNKYVSVNIVDEIKVENHEIIVCVNVSLERCIELNNECRRHGVKFLVANVRGVFSQVFCDFGIHEVIDQTGESEKRGTFSYVDEEGVGTMADGSEHRLEDGIRVAVDDKAYRVNVLSGLQVRLEGYKGRDIRRGVDFEEIKEPMKIEFRSLQECVENGKRDDVLCFENEEVTRHVHELFCRKKSGSKEIEEIFEKSKGVLLSPMCSVMGGLAAQEVIKAASGKFVPIKQFYYFDVYDMVEKNNSDWNNCSENDKQSKDDISDNDSCVPESVRYKAIIEMFGKETFEIMRKMKVFLVGAGAIGCENIKNFVMSGIGKDGMIYITDMDMIERSNLNRQFLFRSEDVGHSKSVAAAREAIAINSDYTEAVKAYESAVGEMTENVFSDTFMAELDIVTNALDNLEARNYMDKRCIEHCVPMFDAGTSGTKGHVQCVIPYLTESYQSTRDPVTKDVPMCTIRLFPATIDHTISWAVELFKKLFELDISKINKYLETNSIKITSELKEKLKKIKKNIITDEDKQLKHTEDKTDIETVSNLLGVEELENEKDNTGVEPNNNQFAGKDEDLLSEYQNEENSTEMVKDAPITVELCINKALSLFINIFSTQIQSFLRAFPADTIRKDGLPFWAPPKRLPTPISFNINDKLHILFVETCANLYAACFKVRKISRNEVFLYLENVLSLCEPSPITFGDKTVEIDSCNTVTYDKDTWHSDFIYAAANIRARNFRIKEQTKLYIKGVSGKIIPAIATTTAIVSGLMTLEIIRHARFQVLKNQQLMPIISTGKNKKLENGEFEKISEIFKNKSNINIEDAIQKINRKDKYENEIQLLENYEKGLLKYKNTFMDLSMPFLSRVDTVPPKIDTYNAHGCDVKYTIWSSIYLPDMTLQQIIDILSAILQREVSAVLLGSKFIYWDILEKYKKNLNCKISELALNQSGKFIQPINYVTEDLDFEGEAVNVIFD